MSWETIMCFGALTFSVTVHWFWLKELDRRIEAHRNLWRAITEKTFSVEKTK